MKSIKIAILCLGLLAATQAVAQVSTNCTTIGNTTHCDTVDYDAQRQQAYENGQRTGAAVGGLISSLVQRHQYHSLVNQQCHQNGAGSQWTIIWNNGREDHGYCTAKQAGVKTK
jgi:hypothetical protein